jgi:methylenetetrahydrofolate dehydrogenase (NADP+)/methenyltetrahydrofolate cyclohydrolase
MILSGKDASNFFYKKLLERINNLEFKPMLSAVQIGDNPASSTYLKIKKRKIEELGLSFELIKFDENISKSELIKEIDNLNRKASVTGIIIQLPLPESFDLKKILNTIDDSKDVDCLTDLNLGRMFSSNDELYPATAKGVIRLLEYYKINISGKNICVVGRSNLVTKPLALRMTSLDATVTICHSKTTDLSSFTKNADIVISGIGKANFMHKEFFNPGQILIDIGTSIDNKGKLSGDMDYENLFDYVSAITPVPGGVGPMTVYGLIENLVLLAERKSVSA